MKSRKGRMLSMDISKSSKLASLSREALVLFLFIIPHLNSHGKMAAQPEIIKGLCVPKIPWLKTDNIPELLQEINDKTNLKWFQRDDLYYLHSLSWKEHQKLDPNKLGEDQLPDYSRTTPGLLHDLSPTTLGEGPRKGKDQGEVQGEAKVEVEAKEQGEGEARRGNPGQAVKKLPLTPMRTPPPQRTQQEYEAEKERQLRKAREAGML
jgi:hypothetical protein